MRRWLRGGRGPTERGCGVSVAGSLGGPEGGCAASPCAGGIVLSTNRAPVHSPCFLTMSSSLGTGKGGRYQGEEGLRVQGREAEPAALSPYFPPTPHRSACQRDAPGCEVPGGVNWPQRFLGTRPIWTFCLKRVTCEGNCKISLYTVSLRAFLRLGLTNSPEFLSQ